MVRVTQRKSSLSIGQQVDRIFSSSQLSRIEYLNLMSAILSDSQITDMERHQINRIFDHVQAGRITLTDA
ncbi:MAG: hypothetical protein HC835_08005 [Oscillatoriales cyanobacterium RM2_1_1]|nr:hypothetical protein [Oscillatoriales cyanobacterium SM2_3_0]NJO45568.1 hypothetical protein [Oscillatoriales cyanobacterium RM2_1_1]